jgi:hypothetical protein
MSAIAAYRDGLRRVIRAPAVVAGLLATATILTAPAALLVRDALRAALGSSLIGERLASGFDLLWWQQFQSGAQGLASDVGPSVIGFTAVVRNLSDLTSPSSASWSSWVVVSAWIVAGTFLSGGILDRYARQRALHAHGFFAACGRLWFRLLRLNLLVLLLYAGLGWLYWLLARPLSTWVTRDLASERAAFAWIVLFAAPAALLGLAITILADTSRVRMVVEDRRSALFAVVAGARFARRVPGQLAVLYVLLLLTTLIVMTVYSMVAPGAAASGAWMWLAFVVSQVYIAARVFAKLLVYASVTSLFQAALAHADYVAQPAPVWPESPAVESLSPRVQS